MAQSIEKIADLIFISYTNTLCPEPRALSFNAQMAKLVDALVSGTSVSNDVQVRVLFWAPEESAERRAQSTNGRVETLCAEP